MRTSPLALLAVVPFTACHASTAAAQPVRTVSPTVEVEILDQAEAKHVSRYSMALVDGRAELVTRDADAKVVVSVRTLPAAEPRLSIEVKRSGRGDELDVSGAIAERPAGRVLVARVERANGQSTSVVAEVK
jgi:hypothetical protein